MNVVPNRSSRENEIIVETKTVSKILIVHESQVLTYLRLANKRLGLIFNFHEAHLRDGIRRIANNL